jgi:hypothetical protein
MLGACPAVCAVQALTTIEAFMTKHFDSNFKEMPVALAAQELKAGTKAGKRVAAAVGEDVAGGEAGGMAGGMAAAEGAPTAKRTRINLSKLDRTFIDGYLDMYVTLSGNATGRARLFASILEAAKLVGTLGSDTWTTKVISDRLHNALKAHNKALAASAEAAEAEAAEAEAAEVDRPMRRHRVSSVGCSCGVPLMDPSNTSHVHRVGVGAMWCTRHMLCTRLR